MKLITWMLNHNCFGGQIQEASFVESLYGVVFSLVVIALISVFLKAVAKKGNKKGILKNDHLKVYDFSENYIPSPQDFMEGKEEYKEMSVNHPLRKSIGIQILIWVLVAIMIIVPFGELLRGAFMRGEKVGIPSITHK